MLIKKEISFKIIEVIEGFFENPSSYDFTLFCLSHTVDSVIKLSFNFTYRISQDNQFITGSSAYKVLGTKKFHKPFLNMSNNYQLSHHIEKILSNNGDNCYQLSISEFTLDCFNFSIMDGIIFTKSNWLTILIKLLGKEYVDESLAIKRYNFLNKALVDKEKTNKQVKV